MAFLLLHRWRDQHVIRIKADAVIAITTVENERATNGFGGTATVLRLGCGAYTEWVAESPGEVISAIASSRMHGPDPEP